MTTLFDELKAAGCRIGGHESDLYVQADDISRPIIRRAVTEKRLAHEPNLFVSQHPNDNGALWYEIPFCHTPFWDARLRRGIDCL